MEKERSNGKEFEWRVSIMMKALGIRVIQDPPRCRDEGVDLIVELPTPLGGVYESVVQCKETFIGGEDVDRLFGTMTRKKKPFGILITEGKASPQADKYIRELNGRIHLIEQEELIELENKSYIGFRSKHI